MQHHKSLHYSEVEYGKSTQGRAILVHSFQSMADAPVLLLLGAVHGDEVESKWLLDHMIEKWKSTPYQETINVFVCPEVNPDGVFHNKRTNAANVDLNRNLPTKDWTSEVKNPRYPPGPSAASEPETKACLKILEKIKPTAILSVHSFGQFQVNANGPSKDWANALSAVCQYPVTENIGYPTPGSLGTYAGTERGIPTITLEIERGLAKEKVLAIHVPVIEASLKFWSKK